MTKILVIGNLACPRHINVANLIWQIYAKRNGPSFVLHMGRPTNSGYFIFYLSIFSRYMGQAAFSFLGRGLFLVSISFSTHVLGFSKMNNALVWAIASLRLFLR
jgi:hypothetical protein